MLDEEENTPRRRVRFERPVLDGWSVEELGEYAAELKAEIARAEETAARKKGARSSADAFFKR